MKPIVFLNSHPIQYFVPLYERISGNIDFNITVWYCSDESVFGKFDRGFGEKVKWDIPLLSGYKYKFIKNYSFFPSIHRGFLGLQNWGIIWLLFKEPKSIIVIHGWGYLTNVLALVFGKIFGHTICLRAETPWNQEQMKNKVKTRAKHFYLRFLFWFVDFFLFIGKQNKLFYKYLGVDECSLIFTPYSVDNNRFRELYLQISKFEARNILGLPLDKKIILFSGKYISKKNPLDLLEAFNQVIDEGAYLVFVGDGELREEMEIYIKSKGISDSVLLTGFVNQSRIPLYYNAADVFVMCSGIGETWGLSVNEALNFGLPILISDCCGCADDLIESGINGEIFETGNTIELSLLLRKYLNKTEAEIEAITLESIRIIQDYSYDKIIIGLTNIG